MASFCERLKGLRTELGWSQDVLADKLGISRSAVGNYEQGTRIPDLESLEQIADIFNVDMAYLTGKQEVKHSHLLPKLTPDIAEVIDLYSKAPVEQQQAFLNLLRSTVPH